MHTKEGYKMYKHKAEVNWIMVFLFVAIVIGLVVYTANVPLGGLLLDGLLYEGGLF